MPRVLRPAAYLFLPGLLFHLCGLAFGRTLNNSEGGLSPSTGIEVVYVVDNSVLTTYDIDPETFEATAVGTTTMPKAKYPRVVSSPDGQFLYYLTDFGFTREDQKLYVYDTDGTGVPGATPVQAFNAGQLTGLEVNPQGTFLYSVVEGNINADGTTPFSIVRNLIDPSRGVLSEPVTEATYQLDTIASGNDCYLDLLGSNPAGTTMYDGIFCSGPHGSENDTYNQRSVVLETGALGPDQQVYVFSSYAGSSNAEIVFENNLMFAFVDPYNWIPDDQYVDVYPAQPDVSAPFVSCTASMLSICGDYGFPAAVHPSGEYVFLKSSTANTDIEQVDLSTQQLVAVGSVQFNVQAFSPDGKVIYGDLSAGSRKIYIAGFNSQNGQVKLGGSIALAHVLDSWSVAERY